MTQTEKMDRAAILHIPLSQYAFAASEYGITIRLRAKKRRFDQMCALYGGPGMQENPCLLYRSCYAYLCYG